MVSKNKEYVYPHRYDVYLRSMKSIEFGMIIKYTLRMKKTSKNLISANPHHTTFSSVFLPVQFITGNGFNLFILFSRKASILSPRRRRRRQPNPKHLFQLKLYDQVCIYVYDMYIASTYAIFVYIFLCTY